MLGNEDTQNPGWSTYTGVGGQDVIVVRLGVVLEGVTTVIKVDIGMRGDD